MTLNMEKHYYIYIILCNDKSFYTGITNNVDSRLYEHNKGIYKNCYTYNRRPLKLVYVEAYNNPMKAIRREKQIKKWSRKKKDALIKGNQNNLILLAKCKNIIYHRSHTSTSSV